jgi:hypothetical protein
MTYDLALQRFGIPAAPADRESILLALKEAVTNVALGKEDAELIRCLSVQLMSIGDVRDSMSLWKAKSGSFDLMCGMDVHFLCGAGVDETMEYLRSLGTGEAKEALDYLNDTVLAGDFEDWSPAIWTGKYRSYYGLDV